VRARRRRASWRRHLWLIEIALLVVMSGAVTWAVSLAFPGPEVQDIAGVSGVKDDGIIQVGDKHQAQTKVNTRDDVPDVAPDTPDDSSVTASPPADPAPESPPKPQ
jgi:hypothetical protein